MSGDEIVNHDFNEKSTAQLYMTSNIATNKDS